MKKQIPCKDCICLAICKSKSKIYCSILFDHLDALDSKELIDKSWDWLRTQFLRDRSELLIDKEDNYTNALFRVY